MTRENILNAVFLGWTWVTFMDVVTFTLGAVGALTLIWMNIERAMKARQERQNGCIGEED
jgi:UDP-N-acetyl-D-mannosaminuronic acid transferase (WecB/TagA/CpsF family)